VLPPNPEDALVVFVDGHAVWIPLGFTMFQACEVAGVDIPPFCYLPLHPFPSSVVRAGSSAARPLRLQVRCCAARPGRMALAPPTRLAAWGPHGWVAVFLQLLCLGGAGWQFGRLAAGRSCGGM
jgi:hypothetical protein